MMMPDIRVSNATLERLKALAEPFVDTPETVIARVLDHYKQSQSTENSTAEKDVNAPATPATRFDALNAPDLTHTKLLSAVVDGREASRWNDVVNEAHRAAMGRVNDFNKLSKLSKSQIVKGQKSDRGYHYLEDLDLSIQGIDADYAFKNALHLARNLAFPIRVEFEWRHKPGAAYPGTRGVLEWTPTRTTA